MSTEILDSLKRQWNIGTDAELAEILGLTKASISQIRAGKQSLGVIPTLKALDLLGYGYAQQAITALLPENTRRLIIEREQERLKRNRGNKKADERQVESGHPTRRTGGRKKAEDLQNQGGGVGVGGVGDDAAQHQSRVASKPKKGSA